MMLEEQQQFQPVPGGATCDKCTAAGRNPNHDNRICTFFTCSCWKFVGHRSSACPYWSGTNRVHLIRFPCSPTAREWAVDNSVDLASAVTGALGSWGDGSMLCFQGTGCHRTYVRRWRPPGFTA